MLMTKTKKGNKGAASILTEFVDKSAVLVKKFRNFKDAELGIGTDRAYNPMEILEAADGTIDPIKAARTAILCENFLRQTKHQARKGELDETSRANLPAWVKNGLALITSAQSEDLMDKIISLQALSNRTGKIHYLDVVSERGKGRINDRDVIFDALKGFRGNENFSSEKVDVEVIGSPGGTDFSVVLGYGPIIPGTLIITDGTQVIRDDRNGLLTGATGAPGGGITNSVDYLTRAVSVRFAAATTDTPRVSYSYNIEAALQYPEYGIHLRAETVEARPRAIGTTWSQQAVFDFLNDFGIDAEPTILEAGGRLIMMEKFKHVVNELTRSATGGIVIFDNTAPTGVSYRDHLKTFSIYLSRLQDLTWEATQTVRPNTMVIHPSILFAVAFQDGYQGQNFANDGISGPRFVGRLTNHGIDVIADPTYNRNKGMLTYRGPEFVSTAAVLGSYIELYKAPVHTRAFRKDTAMLTEYCIKIIDSDMISTFEVINL